MLTRRAAMSEYVYHCENCNQEFTRSLHMSEHDKGGITCPHCGSQRVQQVVTAFSAVTARKS
ncbi:MAG: FmdB family zinc ribbon protein [Acidobacteriota bacterium]